VAPSSPGVGCHPVRPGGPGAGSVGRSGNLDPGTTRHRVARGTQRIIGTVLRLIVLAGVLLLNPAPWQTVLVIAVCQFGAEMFIARQYVLAQVFVTPLALSATLLAGADSTRTVAAGQDS